MTAASTDRRLVKLGNSSGANPVDFLLVDVHDGQVRLAHWWLRSPWELGQGFPPAPQQPFDRLKADGIITETAKPEQWGRKALQSETLDDAVCTLFLDHSRHEWSTVLAYIRATAWGADLP